MSWSVVSEESSCFPLALWLTKWWLICCSVTVLCPGSEATLHREPWAGFSLCFLSLDCECTRGSSIPTQLCAFSPWVHSGDTRGSALTCPVWVFMPCLLWGLTAALLVAPFTPAACGVSRASTCSSVEFLFTDSLSLLVTWRPSGGLHAHH